MWDTLAKCDAIVGDYVRGLDPITVFAQRVPFLCTQQYLGQRTLWVALAIIGATLVGVTWLLTRFYHLDLVERMRGRERP